LVFLFGDFEVLSGSKRKRARRGHFCAEIFELFMLLNSAALEKISETEILTCLGVLDPVTDFANRCEIMRHCTCALIP
jgi:hypothetical protein